MSLQDWANVFSLLGLPAILAFQWYMGFIRTPANNNKEFCDNLKKAFPDRYAEMMRTNPQAKATCCQFAGHAGTDACK